MRVVLQVVNEASVVVNKQVVGSINKGYLLLVGIYEDDSEEKVVKLTEKISKLRVFPDNEGKTNLSLRDVDGSILSVSQFTLCADLNGYNRPSFVNAAKREDAVRLYNLLNEELRKKGFEVQTGEFGADMKVSLINDGPFTLVLES